VKLLSATGKNDEAGNLEKLRHIAKDSARSFTRNITVDTQSNRALPENMGEPADFKNSFDANGNMEKLEHIAEIKWNYRDNISSATIIKREN